MEADTAEHGPILRTEVLNALIEVDIPKDSIEGIEAPRKNKYFVVFKDFISRRLNINKRIQIREKWYQLTHPNPTPQHSSQTRVKIFYYPLDEDTKNLETVLRHYGSFREGSIKDLEDRSCGVKNGIKQVYMDVKKSIPSFFYVGKNLVRIEYLGQMATCRKCHQSGHIAQECENLVACRGCGAQDHPIARCPEVICFQCGKQGHTTTHCYQYDEEFPDMNGEKKTDEEEEEETKSENESDNLFGATWEEPTEHMDEDKDGKTDGDTKDEEDKNKETENQTEKETEKSTEKSTEKETETEGAKEKEEDEEETSTKIKENEKNTTESTEQTKATEPEKPKEQEKSKKNETEKDMETDETKDDSDSSTLEEDSDDDEIKEDKTEWQLVTCKRKRKKKHTTTTTKAKKEYTDEDVREERETSESNH